MEGEATTVRVLAVDDLESNLLALEAVLRDAPVDIVRARSGQEALSALLKEEFALILLDVQMPEMDGFETAAAIRSRKKSSRIPIIFLTAHGASPEKLGQAYAAGAADFLTKPLDEDALRAKVATIVDLWRRIEETKLDVERQIEERVRNERHRWETEALQARIAEYEKANAAEQRARLDAERSNRLKDEFLATVSHELRTPLNAILGWATILKSREATGPSLARGLEVIERNAHVQVKLVEELLDLSRISAGDMHLDLRSTSVPAVIADAIVRTAASAAEKIITVSARVEENFPSIAADANRLQQVVTNLVSNAIKFNHDGGQVEISAERTPTGLRIQVKDTGIGIAPDVLPRIFDPFHQGDSSRTRRHRGLGIGLPVALHLIRLHGGELSAESLGVGAGATFTITLPVEGQSKVDTESRDVGRAQRAAPTKPLGGVRALVVDDDPDARAVVDQVLTAAGATVLAAASADAAFDAFIAWSPNVIVSDIGMPGQDGYSLLARIRAVPEGSAEHVPALALTAYASAADVTRAHVVGFQRHLTKPIDHAQLIAAVATLASPRPRLA